VIGKLSVVRATNHVSSQESRDVRLTVRDDGGNDGGLGGVSSFFDLESEWAGMGEGDGEETAWLGAAEGLASLGGWRFGRLEEIDFLEGRVGVGQEILWAIVVVVVVAVVFIVAVVVLDAVHVRSTALPRGILLFRVLLIGFVARQVGEEFVHCYREEDYDV
jgi:hypothetical protein